MKNFFNFFFKNEINVNQEENYFYFSEKKENINYYELFGKRYFEWNENITLMAYIINITEYAKTLKIEKEFFKSYSYLIKEISKKTDELKINNIKKLKRYEDYENVEINF